MRYSKLMVATVVGSLFAQPLFAAPTAEEAAQLGQSLTAFGAIKAGNKEGTIPAYDGGLCAAPAGYKPTKGEQGGTPYVDPYAGDKPLFKITAADVAKYADKLDEGVKELFKRNPQTFAVEVYPTHRSACFPSWMYENTIKNVMKPKVVWTNGAPGLVGAHAQIPFPIPKNGVEEMWNLQMKPDASDVNFDIDIYIIDTAGSLIHSSTQNISNLNDYWNNSLTSVPEGKPFWSIRAAQTYPPSQVGTAQLRWALERPDLKDPPTWAYTPGQRRVRLAPEFSYDGVSTSSGGILLYDEINGFDGKMDRFDYKLVGRKEMYMPYNVFKYWTAPIEQVWGPKHIKPEALRFELHRVWVIEATLKPGERHVQKKKIFYIDEDSHNMLTYVGLDNAEKPHHYMQYHLLPLPGMPEGVRNSPYTLYDLNKGMYSLANRIAAPGMKGVVKVSPSYPANYFTSDALAGSGVR